MPARIGFIGVGGIAREHLKNLDQIADARVAAICDVAADAARKVGEQFSCPWFTDYREMLDREQLDALYVCTPPFARGDAEIAAAERGLHLFVEKPVALDLDVARRILESTNRANVMTSVGYVYRYLPGIELARKALAGRAIGMVVGHYFSSVPATPWWRIRARSGGQLVEQATHIVDTMRYLGGDVVEVSGHARHRLVSGLPDFDVDDVTTMQVTFGNGAIGQLACTCAGVPGGSSAGLTVIADGVTVDVLGTQGVRIRRDGHTEEHTYPPSSLFKLEDELFVQSIITGNRSLARSTLADAIATLQVTLAAGESARTGQSIRLNG